MSEPRGRLLLRELGVLAIAALATALVTWPLALHLTSFERLADHTLDDHVYWWDFWWLHEALLVRHVDPFTCPLVFHPHGASVALSPFALPIGLLALPLQSWLGVLPGAVAAVKLCAFASFPLALHGTSLLARRLGVPFLASLLVGACVAFTPFRMVQLGRVHYLAGAFVPYFLHAALLAARTRRVRWFVASALWFALAGAVDGSLLLELLLATGALLGFEVRRGALFVPTAARLLACGLLGALLLSPLLVRMLHDARASGGVDVASKLEFEDEPRMTQKILSPDLDGVAWYLSPALHEATLADAHEATLPMTMHSSARLTAELIHDTFRPSAQLASLDPRVVAGLDAGAAALVLLVGAVAVGLGLRERGAWSFALLAAIGLVLALGPRRTFGSTVVEMPYGWLARLVPGMAAGRYPVAHLRLFALGTALVGGLGLARVAAAPTGAARGRWLAVAALVAAGAFLAAAPLRTLRFEPVRFESVHEAIAADPTPGAVLELPRREIVLRRMALGQILHGRPLIGGPLTRVAPDSARFFTDEPVVQRLMHPPIVTTPLDPAIAAEVDEDVAILKRYDVRFIVVRRGLFGVAPEAFDQVARWLAAHGFATTLTREGHLLARVAP